MYLFVIKFAKELLVYDNNKKFFTLQLHLALYTKRKLIYFNLPPREQGILLVFLAGLIYVSWALKRVNQLTVPHLPIHNK